MSTSIDDLYQKLLESGFSEEELERQVHSKAKEFGGFMSKQGILYIIAKENGIYFMITSNKYSLLSCNESLLC